MRHRVLMLGVAAVIAAMFAIPPTAHAQVPPGTARIGDPSTTFHRLYVLGCPQLPIEAESFADDAGDMQRKLDENEAAASTAKTVTRPTMQELLDAIAALKAAAKPGDEVTITLIGHGTRLPGGVDEPFNEAFHLNCGTVNGVRQELDGDDDGDGKPDGDGDFLTDDVLASFLRNFPDGVTLVLVADTCWGGGFTGGARDLMEDTDTAVLGPEGECPIDNQWSPFGGTRLFDLLELTFAEAIGNATAPFIDGEVPADGDGDGIVTADELKAFLEENGWNTGPPDDVADPPDFKLEVGSSRCVMPGGGCNGPDLQLDPPAVMPGGTLRLAGRGFAPGEAVLLTAHLNATESFPLEVEAVADHAGAFEVDATVDLPIDLYLVHARGASGRRDSAFLTVANAGGAFADDNGSVHEPYIEAIHRYAIAQGCADGRYCPGGIVTRGQLAAFLARALDLPLDRPSPFSDDDSSVFEEEIAALAAAGITTGCAPGRYCPSDPVTRGQAASLLVRALGLTGVGSNRFIDDDGSVHRPAIELLAARGMISGCSTNRFCPSSPLTRGQMAALLARGGMLPPLNPPPPIDVDGDDDGETVVGDPTLAPGHSLPPEDLDGDGRPDRVRVGTGRDGRIAGGVDLDGDGDDEVVVDDSSASPGTAPENQSDRDGDGDTVAVGTGGGGRVVGQGNTHREGQREDGQDRPDSEVICVDPGLGTGQVVTANPDNNRDADMNPDDTDADVIWIGTREGGEVTAIGDRDDDGDDDIEFADPTVPVGTTEEVDLDGDGDPDLFRVGTGPP